MISEMVKLGKNLFNGTSSRGVCEKQLLVLSRKNFFFVSFMVTIQPARPN